MLSHLLSRDLVAFTLYAWWESETLALLMESYRCGQTMELHGNLSMWSWWRWRNALMIKPQYCTFKILKYDRFATLHSCFHYYLTAYFSPSEHFVAFDSKLLDLIMTFNFCLSLVWMFLFNYSLYFLLFSHIKWYYSAFLLLFLLTKPTIGAGAWDIWFNSLFKH